ncbi:MAG: hypothetical protein SCABRO_02583 [Candidatus Scalindua brodae]|uniref:Uncharacterized protein n=1 Tax=Candidatus Scalindua brodae TaxID=237368 RepID=A0A0B0EGJ1_9BACT|nr:MAG: hypothetical protein SCABRO_02583 [Candidatus Scalindua brodae]
MDIPSANFTGPEDSEEVEYEVLIYRKAHKRKWIPPPESLQDLI